MTWQESTGYSFAGAAMVWGHAALFGCSDRPGAWAIATGAAAFMLMIWAAWREYRDPPYGG